MGIKWKNFWSPHSIVEGKMFFFWGGELCCLKGGTSRSLTSVCCHFMKSLVVVGAAAAVVWYVAVENASVVVADVGVNVEDVALLVVI